MVLLTKFVRTSPVFAWCIVVVCPQCQCISPMTIHWEQRDSVAMIGAQYSSTPSSQHPAFSPLWQWVLTSPYSQQQQEEECKWVGFHHLFQWQEWEWEWEWWWWCYAPHAPQPLSVISAFKSWQDGGSIMAKGRPFLIQVSRAGRRAVARPLDACVWISSMMRS